MVAKLRLIKSDQIENNETLEKRELQHTIIQAYREILPIRYAKGTISSWVSAMKHFEPWMEEQGLYLWDVKPYQFDVFSNALSKQISKGTHTNYNTQLSNFYDWIVQRQNDVIMRKFGVVIENPIDRWNTPQRKYAEDETPTVPNPEAVNYYFQRQKKDFADAKDNQHKRDIFLFGRRIAVGQVMLKAGLRVQEVTHLDIEDIDFDRMLIFVKAGKGNKDRIVDMTTDLAPVLKWYIDSIFPLLKAKERGRNQPLFLSEGKTRLAKPTIQHEFFRFQEVYNLPIDQRFTPHGLRRLFATNLYFQLQAERHPDPLMYIKSQLGHVFLSTTLKYCQIPESAFARVRRESYAIVKAALGSGGTTNDDQMESSNSHV